MVNMEITLEKIELVKDRTGVSYKEAKEALERTEGSVVDAIIAIEEGTDIKRPAKVNEYVQGTIAKAKELVSKGNISKISVKHNGESILNIPLSVGIVGAVVAPWGLIAGAIASFGFRCQVELITDEGKVIDISEKADTLAMNAREKGEVIFDEVKEKAPEVWDKAKEAGLDAWDKTKEAGLDAWDKTKDKAPEVWDKAKEAGAGAWDKAKDFGANAIDSVKEKRAEKALDNLDIEIEMSEGIIDDELNSEEK